MTMLSKRQRLANETITRWCQHGKCHYIDQLFSNHPEFAGQIAELYRQGMEGVGRLPEKWDIAHQMVQVNSNGFVDALLKLDRQKRDPRGEVFTVRHAQRSTGGAALG